MWCCLLLILNVPGFDEGAKGLKQMRVSMNGPAAAPFLPVFLTHLLRFILDPLVQKEVRMCSSYDHDFSFYNMTLSSVESYSNEFSDIITDITHSLTHSRTVKWTRRHDYSPPPPPPTRSLKHLFIHPLAHL